MSKKLYEETNIQDIAAAIREKNGSQNVYTVAQMGNAVRAIHTDPVLESLSVTENGNYLPSAGKDGFSSVSVNVEGGSEAVVQSLTVTQNGTYNPPSGVDGYAPVTVNVSGGGSDPDLPNEYQKVEYLSITGTQYVTVQSGLGSAGVMTVIDVSQDVISTSEAGFAGYCYTSTNITELYIKGSVRAYIHNYPFSSSSMDGAISENLSANTRYSIRFVWLRALGAYFNIGQYRPGSYPFTGKIYRAEFIPQFSNNPTALLIPCYRKSDLEPGFYDVINNVFYTNVGTGTFGVGPDVN